MARARLRFTQTDAARALRVAAMAPTPHAVEIAPDGTIRIVPAPQATGSTGTPASAHAAEAGATDNELDAMFGWTDGGATSKIYTARAAAKIGCEWRGENGRNANIYSRTYCQGAG